MKTYETYVEEINEAIASVKSIRSSNNHCGLETQEYEVLRLMRWANRYLTTDEYEKLKKDIDLYKPTIKGLEEIISDDREMENFTKGGMTWGKLSFHRLMNEEALGLDIDNGIQSAISTGKVSSITQKEIDGVIETIMDVRTGVEVHPMEYEINESQGSHLNLPGRP